MKTLSGFCVVALIASTSLFAQNRSGFVPAGPITRGFGNVVLPGGTSAMPGIQRTTGNVVYPAGGGLQIGIPSNQLVRPNLGRPGAVPHRRPAAVGYAYPVYVGGTYYPDPQYAEPAMAAAPPQQPNVTVVYPPPAAPVIINHYGPGDQSPVGPAARIFEVPRTQAAQEEPPAEPEHYLIAFKDRSIYSAIAYWVEGDTLHYFTSGNTHNQVSVSLVDRELTTKLNSDSGHQVKLPPAK